MTCIWICMKRDFSTVQAMLYIWSRNMKNLITGLEDDNVWHAMRLAKRNTVNGRWDCVTSCFFYYYYCFADDRMFNRRSNFTVIILTFVRSLMVSVLKWKGHQHWQFSPAVIKMFLAATPALLCVIIVCLLWNVHLLLSSFCLYFLLRTMFHSLFKWLNSGMVIHI